MSKMPDNIQNIYDNLTGFQKAYCDYRSKGLTQAVASEKAGSNAKDKIALSSVGHQIEQFPGVREYIDYLKDERAKVMPVDEVEILAKLRKVYEEALDRGKFNDANKALELMGTMIGVFGRNRIETKTTADTNKGNNTEAFKEDNLGSNEASIRLAKVQSMMKDLGK